MVLACAVVAVAGCDRRERAGPTAPAGQDDPGTQLVGAVGLALSLTANVTVSAVDYSITGNGITPRTGLINVSDAAATPSLQVGGVPAGSGYLVALTASSVDGQTTCNGSGMVDVLANQVSLITVVMQCRATGTTGVITVGGGFNNCPSITSYSGAPATVAVGGAVTVSVSATDPDGDALMFGWTAPSGRFGDTGAPVTTFTCAANGPVTLTMTITDGMCPTSITLPITCVPFCQVRADGTPCDDGNACTRTDACQAGVCVGTNPVLCTALDQCHDAGTCAGQTGLCSNPAVADGTSCSLRNASAACTAGACGLVACQPGLGDCDLLASTGCEVSLQSSVSNCGMCGRACSAGSTCAAGLCIAAPPTALSAVAGGWKSQLAWTAVPDATSYTVLRGLSGSGMLQPIGDTRTMQFLDDAVASGVAYTYAVASNSEGGPSAPSLTVAATALAKQVCVSDDDNSIRVFDSSQSGAAVPVRTLTAGATELQSPEGLTSNLGTGELFVALFGGQISGETLVGQLDPTNSFQQILAFGWADTGNQAPKRVLGGTANTMVGGWAVAYDRVHDEVFSACNCNNLIMVFDRTASGNAAPKRTIQLPGPIVRVSSLMLDTAKDTLWVAGWGGLSKDQLLEIPRGSSGPATPLRMPVSLGLAGNAPRLARCN